MSLLALLGVLVSLNAFVSPAAAVPPPASVTLESSASSITVPESYTLTATTSSPVDGSGYWIKIYNADSGQLLVQCSGGSTCSYIDGASWSDNVSRTRHYIARVSPYGTNFSVADSGTIAVQIQRYEFPVSISTSPSAVTVPAGYTVTATSERSLTNTGYWLKVWDDDANQMVTQCSSGTACSIALGTGWNENANPRTRHFSARVARYYGEDVSGVSSSQPLPVRKRVFPVSLSFSAQGLGADGKMRYTAVAGTDLDMSVTPYRLTIRRLDDSTMSALCTTGTTCTATVEANHVYRATVEDYGGQSFGKSSTYSVDNAVAMKLDDNGVDVYALTGLFASTQALCNTILVAPPYLGTYQDGSTVSQQYQACEGSVHAGEPIRLALAAIVAVGGYGILAWALNHPDITPPPEPGCEQTHTCPPPPRPPAAPVTAPPSGAYPIEEIASTIADKNPDAVGALSATDLATIARECIGRMAEAGYDVNDCGTLPIFITGFDANEAAIHDREALTSGVPGSLRTPDPRWIRLNRMKRSLQPSPGARWLDGEPECQTQAEPRPHCDEFPFLGTEQGGPNGGSLASLKLIPALANTTQGTKYGFGPPSFRSMCKMGSVGEVGVHGVLTHGDPFIALPIPDVRAINTITNLCNGKTEVGG